VRDLAETMAIEVLKGDRVAAYALADMLLEERDGGVNKMAEAAKEIRENHPTAVDGYGVYRWPEFQAFCKRAGILWDLRTVSMVIYVEEGATLKVEHNYRGSDVRTEEVT
jgi:hypothetical protein